jgi:hypothetical protein
MSRVDCPRLIGFFRGASWIGVFPQEDGIYNEIWWFFHQVILNLRKPTCMEELPSVKR